LLGVAGIEGEKFGTLRTRGKGFSPAEDVHLSG
jgi:hypothetical protein